MSSLEEKGAVCELDSLLNILPETTRESLLSRKNVDELIEIVLDCGRLPVARFPDGDVNLWENPVSKYDLDDVAAKVGRFRGNNRAGIDGTLHRISALRNQDEEVIGLTCRVGRYIPDSAAVIEDIVKESKSVLILGAPGAGKTTVVRSICRILADEKKRVMIVDTSNEIAGDGDVPHASIGSSRRMQVVPNKTQYDTMIEALENHMPEVIVVDEIGTVKECEAAETISKRGVQLIATTHAKSLSDLIKDPVLRRLVGNTQAVILGDFAAKNHAKHSATSLLPGELAKKVMLERKGDPAFDVVVVMDPEKYEEKKDKEWRIYRNPAKAVDQHLKDEHVAFERRLVRKGKLFCIPDADHQVNIKASTSQAPPKETPKAKGTQPPSSNKTTAKKTTETSKQAVELEDYEDLYPDIVAAVLKAKDPKSTLAAVYLAPGMTPDMAVKKQFSELMNLIHPENCDSNDAWKARRKAGEDYNKLLKNKK